MWLDCAVRAGKLVGGSRNQWTLWCSEGRFSGCGCNRRRDDCGPGYCRRDDGRSLPLHGLRPGLRQKGCRHVYGVPGRWQKNCRNFRDSRCRRRRWRTCACLHSTHYRWTPRESCRLRRSKRRSRNGVHALLHGGWASQFRSDRTVGSCQSGVGRFNRAADRRENARSTPMRSVPQNVIKHKVGLPGPAAELGSSTRCIILTLLEIS